MKNNEWKHEYIKTNNIRMHYVTFGQGKLLILLHGFPEFWYSWRFQINELGKYFRVVAPDLRGYNKTDKPKGVENYKINILIQDILGLVEGLEEGKAVIIGHDWGGALSWEFAKCFPKKTEKLVILNCPPISVLQEEILKNKDQARRSQYIMFFQTPEVPEKSFSARNYELLRSTYTNMAIKKELWDDDTLNKYVKALELPSIACGINYYRASYKFPLSTKQSKLKVQCPTLVIWGEQDKALSIKLTEYFSDIVEGTYMIKFIPTAGHWVQLEEPELVNKYILEFLI
ncbi:MAG: alpha/beta fold hydrolase [Candidatus Helarchaeota archaeon]